MPFYSKDDEEELKILLMGVSGGGGGRSSSSSRVGYGGYAGSEACAGADFLIASARVQVACVAWDGSGRVWWSVVGDGRGFDVVHTHWHTRMGEHTR